MFDQLLDIIKSNNEFIILRHIEPDYDALGSQFALKEIIKSNFENKKVFMTGKMPKSYSHLGLLDEFEETDFENKVVLITDTATSQRIDIKNVKWLQKAKLIVKIDHHVNIDHYGDCEIVDDSYPATCELLADFLLQQNLKINSTIASYLYYGLVSDTERFLYRQISSRTFKMAEFLVKYIDNIASIYQNLYKLDDNQLKLKGFIYNNYVRTNNNIVYVKLDKKILETYQIKEPHNIALWVNLLAEFNNPKIWMFFVETADYIRVELRSYQYEVNLFANHIGGGGHKQAAGAKLKTWKEVDNFINFIEENISM